MTQGEQPAGLQGTYAFNADQSPFVLLKVLKAIRMPGDFVLFQDGLRPS